jgi:nicotinamide phosphoribosyltransferase
MSAALLTDAYKLFHKSAFKEGINYVYDNFTNRSGRLSNIPANIPAGVSFVGLQYFIKDVLINEWNETFFNQNKDIALAYIQKHCNALLGFEYDAQHFSDLHDLGYLPLLIKALPEGSFVPYGVPCCTFINTNPKFEWLPNFIETVFSTENWPIQTSATTSRAYLKQTIDAFDKAGVPHDLIMFMNHDFSMRGMFGRHAAAMSGFGQLTASAGTDTLPAIMFAEKYYNADVSNELVGASVPATEHSTTTSYIMAYAEENNCSKAEAEIAYVRYLFTKVPSGIMSHVSDSFDFWDFVENSLPLLKDEIMARDGKFVIRPDSGDPVKILTGYTDDEIFLQNGEYFVKDGCSELQGISTKSVKITEIERKGLIEALWDIFSGWVNEKSYRVLDDHIGAIYGDSITLERQQEIYTRLMDKGFAPIVVLGTGSYSYQYVTRDTHGSAVKATWVETENGAVEVCKDPKTDSKKKSAKGLLRVEKVNGTFVLYDQQTEEQELLGELKPVFQDGNLLYETSLQTIREVVLSSL